MRAVRITAVSALVFVIQIAFVAKMRVFGVHPDLLLVFALAVGITGGRNRGAVAGFGAGLAADVFMTSALGVSAMAYTIVCYAVGAFAENGNNAPWTMALIGLLGAAAGFGLFVAVGEFTGDISTSIHHAITVVSIESIFAAVVTPVLTRSLRNIWDARSPAW